MITKVFPEGCMHKQRLKVFYNSHIQIKTTLTLNVEANICATITSIIAANGKSSFIFMFRR